LVTENPALHAGQSVAAYGHGVKQQLDNHNYHDSQQNPDDSGADIEGHRDYRAG
jgi:hypothetical protein